MTSSRSRPRKTASVRRSTARAAPSATTCRPSAAVGVDARDPRGRLSRRTGDIRGLERRRRHAGAHVLDPDHGCQPVMPARGEHRRAAGPDSAVRRRPGRGHSGRDAAGAGGSRRSQRRRHQRTRRDRHGRRHRRPRVGRFGWKAQHATLLAFSADAYRNEMGITNDLFPQRAGRRRLRGRDAPLRSDDRSRRHARSADPPARHRQLRDASCVFSRRSARGAGRRDGARR